MLAVLPQTVLARAPGPSFGSRASAVGNGPESASRAPVMSSLPQPVSGSRPIAQARQPSAGVMSTAERSSSVATWSGVSVGSVASRSAAAADTWGAANEVPSPPEYSSPAQSE